MLDLAVRPDDSIVPILRLDTLLLDIEPFARLVRPPLLELAVLVVQPSSRVEGVLRVS